jgi:hypothetical protein
MKELIMATVILIGLAVIAGKWLKAIQQREELRRPQYPQAIIKSNNTKTKHNGSKSKKENIR